jgi:glyoxylase-like metal-dependent hydrolase (beta-lactamase superfamily II)
MLKRLSLAILVLLGIAVLTATAVLVSAHLAVRRETAPLPSLEAIDAVAAVGEIVDDAPVRIAVVNTASQPMPRANVLESARDPDRDRPYVMSYPAFAVEWKDGRILLVDLGMTRAGARSFGKPLEWLGGAAPIEPHGSVAEILGDAAARVKAAVFTHLHVDHVGGVGELCAHVNSLRVPLTTAQAEHINYTTQPGLNLLDEADCVRLERVSGGPLFPVAGYPGVFLIDAGGHTPGSQIVLVFVRDESGAHRYAFAGDIVNNADAITNDIPKPLLYRTLIVPESEARQAELRAYLKRLRDEGGFTLIVSHDEGSLQATGLPVWTAPVAGP